MRPFYWPFYWHFKRWYSKNFACLLSFFLPGVPVCRVNVQHNFRWKKRYCFVLFCVRLCIHFLFSIITDCHKLSGLKKYTNLLYYSLGGQTSNTSVIKLRTRPWQVGSLLETEKKNHFLVFSSFWRLPLFLGSQPPPPFSKPTIVGGILMLLLSEPLSCRLLLKTHVIRLGPSR